MLQIRLVAALIGVCVILSMSACSKPEASKSGRLRVVMIPKGTTHVFWQTVEKGARRAEAELGIDLVWKGPLQENDRAQQIQLVQQFLTEGVDALCLAPLDHAALAGPVGQARAKNVPVVIFDSDLDGTPGKDFASFVATNNRAGGRKAGEHLAQLLGDSGEVVLLRYVVGSASTAAREDGFLEALKTKNGIKVTVDNRYAGATAGEAKTESLNMLDRLKTAKGVFCSNESATNGMLMALRQSGLAKKLKFIGFDASPPLVEALKAGDIDALIVQDPRNMGYLAVKTAVAAKRGEKVEAIVDTGCVLVTRDNMNDESIRRLLD